MPIKSINDLMSMKIYFHIVNTLTLIAFRLSNFVPKKRPSKMKIPPIDLVGEFDWKHYSLDEMATFILYCILGGVIQTNFSLGV